MGLHIDETTVEYLLGPVDRQLLDLIRRRAALIVALARIALCIFVGEDAALSFQHRLRDDIFRGDQLNLVLLALQFLGDASEDRRICIGQVAREIAFGADIGEVGLGEGGGAHRAGSLKRGLGEFFDTATMAATAEFGGKKSGDAGFGHIHADQARAQGQHVGVIMLTRQRCGKRLGNQSTATGRIAVHRDGNADSRAAQRNAALRRARGDRAGELVPEIGIIHAVGRRGAKVIDLVPFGAQPFGKFRLRINGGMIGS